MNVLIRNAQLADGRICDLYLENGQISAIGSNLQQADALQIDARGLACGIAFQDHHLHLRATAARQYSWACDDGTMNCAADFQQGLIVQQPDANGWIRVIGFHESTCGELNGDELSAIRNDVPIRVQHSSGRLWILNFRARQLLGSGPWDEQGCLWDQDAWLRQKLSGMYPQTGAGLAEISRRLARYGVVGVTDTSPSNSSVELAQFRQAQASGELRQRLLMMGNASLNASYLPLRQQSELMIGAQKFHLLESALPDLDGLCQQITDAHAVARPVAFHCVTRTELVFALAALQQCGVMAGDRIEHAGICPDELLAEMRKLCVVTQPVFIHDRGDRYLAQVDAAEQNDLYRLRGLLEGGLALAGSTDAPYGCLDPWQGIVAAMQRLTRIGQPIGLGEALSFDRAYQLWTGSLLQPGQPRHIEVGSEADICLWNRDWAEIRQNPAGTRACLSLKAGEIIWRDGV